jgi:hypothetical protein
MRDNHEGLPELIGACERDGAFFAVVAVTLAGETRQFEIGLQEDAYRAVKRVLGSRPFDQLPGVPYRYFFVPSTARTERGTAEVDFRIEQGAIGRQFSFEIPLSLAENLMWFFHLKEFGPTSHLRCVAPNYP